MSMFGDAATANVVNIMCHEVKRIMRKHKSPAAQAALREVGRTLLRQFDWDVPDWAGPIGKEFAESKPKKNKTQTKRTRTTKKQTK